MDSKKIRKATHAGSWYTSSTEALMKELNGYLAKANKHQNASHLKSIIAPHAGYAYSGPTAAFSFININPENYNRVILLGPSHFEYFEGCGLTQFTEFKTPFGNIAIDTEVNSKLLSYSKSLFHLISPKADEKEHSIEMELPFLKLMFNEAPFTLVSLIVGEINLKSAKEIAKCLREYYEDKKTLFVISSDFCHWGNNFDYTYYDKSSGKIYESIEKMDRMAIDIIKEIDTKKFDEYFTKTQNTICGRNPILILLSIVEMIKNENNKEGAKTIGFECVGYSQSERVTSQNGNSVSYSAIVNYII